MSYPIRSGIWFQDEDDFNKVAADFKDLFDDINKDKLFLHWETYGNGETVEIFESIAKKYPKMTCMGYCQYCGFGGGTHLSVTVNQGDVNVKEELIVEDPAEYEDDSESVYYVTMDGREIYVKPDSKSTFLIYGFNNDLTARHLLYTTESEEEANKIADAFMANIGNLKFPHETDSEKHLIDVDEIEIYKEYTVAEKIKTVLKPQPKPQSVRTKQSIKAPF